MTGQKDRYTTTEKLWKLDDQLLKTPAHDEMVLWLLSEKNILRILPGLEGKCSIKFEVDYEKISDSLCDSIEHIFKKTNDVWNKLALDLPCDEGTNEIVWKIMCDDYRECNRHGTPSMQISSETPIVAGNGFLVGYTDIQLKVSLVLYSGTCFKTTFQYENDIWKPPKHDKTRSISIEVKPKITSFGETLRQLRTYEHYLGHTPMLFTTDMKFKAAFESQGIKVLTYPDDVITKRG